MLVGLRKRYNIHTLTHSHTHTLTHSHTHTLTHSHTPTHTHTHRHSHTDTHTQHSTFPLNILTQALHWVSAIRHNINLSRSQQDGPTNPSPSKALIVPVAVPQTEHAQACEQGEGLEKVTEKVTATSSAENVLNTVEKEEEEQPEGPPLLPGASPSPSPSPRRERPHSARLTTSAITSPTKKPVYTTANPPPSPTNSSPPALLRLLSSVFSSPFRRSVFAVLAVVLAYYFRSMRSKRLLLKQ